MECIAHRNPSKNFNHSPLSLSLPLSSFLLSSPSTLYFLLHSSFFSSFISLSSSSLLLDDIDDVSVPRVRSPRTRLIPRRASFFICPSGNRIWCFCFLSSLIMYYKPFARGICRNATDYPYLSTAAKIILIPEGDKHERRKLDVRSSYRSNGSTKISPGWVKRSVVEGEVAINVSS